MPIEWGDELVTIVQIDQPFCSREYGDGFAVSPHVGCQAILGETGTRKCFNTRITCQDPENYDPETLTLSFSRTQEGLEYLGYVIPSLDSVRITPLKINIGAMDRNLSPFGQREVVSLTFADHQHSDLRVDKYRLERHDGTADQGGAYDPHERGTFWTKWLARNPYYEGYALRVYQGRIGESPSDSPALMQVRHYVIDRIDGPADGAVIIVAKDVFTKVEGRKAKAPFASQGELSADLTGSPSTFDVSPAGIGDLTPAQGGYSTITGAVSGRVAIGDEIIEVTRSGDTFTVVTRADLNTVSEDHDAEDKVQLVLSYVGAEAQAIVSDLLTAYAGIEAALIPLADWDTEAAANFPNLYTGHVAEPTPVSELVGELAEQAGFSIWPDVADNQIRLKAIVPAGSGDIEATVDDDAWIKAGSLKIKRLPEQRASQIWVYYGQINPLEDVEEKKNYRSRLITLDLTAEEAAQYGTASVREVFSRWIPQFGRSSAGDVGERLLAIFRDPPFRASFELHAARDGELDLAAPFRLDTADVTDAAGADRLTAHLPIKLSREDDAVLVEAQQLQFFSQAVGGESPVGADRDLFIDNDTLDFNFRTEHDLLFTAPVSGDVVNLFIAA
jgi:hypothetical protein